MTAAEMLSIAAFLEGKHAQAFPSFGSERMGAPVVSYCRIDDREIRAREPILAPDALIIQDPTLLQSVDVFQGLNPEGFILINSRRSFEDLGIAEFVSGFPAHHVCDVGATELAVKHVGRPVPNAASCWAALPPSPARSTWSPSRRRSNRSFRVPVGAANVAAAREAFELAQAA